jgi:hypothetical protein
VTGRGLQGEVLVDAVYAVPEHDPPRAVEGRDAVLVDESVALAPAAAVGVARPEVGVVRRRYEVLGVREGRHPLAAAVAVGGAGAAAAVTAVGGSGVPADVVGVEMGVDDDVHVLGADPGPLQDAEEVPLPVVELRRAGPLAPVAHAGVDQDRPSPAAQHPCLQRHDRPVALRIPVVRCQPVLVLLPGLPAGRGDELAGGRERPLPLDDPDDLDVPHHHALCAVLCHTVDVRERG